MEPEEIAGYYESGSLGSFSTALMNLICKADSVNRQRIESAFPEYIEAYNIWYNQSYEDLK